jgi:Gpi18-like mannosyltransferase
MSHVDLKKAKPIPVTFLRSWIYDILIPFAVSRAALIVVALLGFHFLHLPITSKKWEVAADGNLKVVTEYLSANSWPFVNMWARWDSGWYLDIARHGYMFIPGKQSNVAFFPLYPYLVRFVHYFIPLPHDAGWLLIGIIIANAAFLVALIYLYHLVRLDYDRSLAARVVLYLCVFPTTLFCSAVYTESLFIALVISSFYYARTGRWFVAGALSAAAALARAPGILLVFPLTFEYFSQTEFNWRRVKPDVLSLTLAPIALLGHLTLLRWQFGDWNVISKTETLQGWNRHFTFPWTTLFRAFPTITTFNGYHGAFEFFFTIALLVLVIFACFRFRPSYAIYSVISLLFIVSWGTLLSAPRFGLMIFPAIMGLALLGQNAWFNRIYLVFSGTLALVSMVVFSQWGWVS